MKIARFSPLIAAAAATALLSGCGNLCITSNPPKAKIEYGTVKFGPVDPCLRTPAMVSLGNSGPYYRVIWPDGVTSDWAYIHNTFGDAAIHFEKKDAPAKEDQLLDFNYPRYDSAPKLYKQQKPRVYLPEDPGCCPPPSR
ncbi:MAG: hypothetical protein BWZ10_02754 [candidate division BRC1 bacterium ADurb.BinA364]|nr:MAG: hypothetical protein BWZ10_02754 [candidate division BRC1 bacterium ADurb.BinA364]